MSLFNFQIIFPLSELDSLHADGKYPNITFISFIEPLLKVESLL